MTIGVIYIAIGSASSPRRRCLHLGKELKNLDGREGSP